MTDTTQTAGARAPARPAKVSAADAASRAPLIELNNQSALRHRIGGLLDLIGKLLDLVIGGADRFEGAVPDLRECHPILLTHHRASPPGPGLPPPYGVRRAHSQWACWYSACLMGAL